MENFAKSSVFYKKNSSMAFAGTIPANRVLFDGNVEAIIFAPRSFKQDRNELAKYSNRPQQWNMGLKRCFKYAPCSKFELCPN